MRLLITGAWSSARDHMNDLQNMGHDVFFLQDERDRLPCAPSLLDGVICNSLFLYHPLEQFTNLQYVQLTSAGLDRVPVEQIGQLGITLHNARGVYSIPMAEFALCGVLQLYKQSRYFMKNQDSRVWAKHRGLVELFGKTICIVGCGSVGSRCAALFEAFGCRVLGANIRPRACAHFEQVFPLEALPTVLSSADIVVLAVPLASRTQHLMDDAMFRSMKRGAILVNLSRGGVVDTQALIRALDGHLGGAVLDVFEQEPLEPDSPLWRFDNVLVTPHNSFVGEGNQDRLSRLILENLARFCGRGLK